MSISEVHVLPRVMEQIRSLGAVAYPNEGCGVLVGRIDSGTATVVDATSARNLNIDRARDRYDLDPSDFLRADHEARERGLDVVGIWHSHPDHPARPSTTDTGRAWVDYVYIICSTNTAGTGDVNAFTLDGEGGSFLWIPLELAPQMDKTS